MINFLFYRHKLKKSLELQNAYKEITLESIEAIARTIDAKDHYTNGHSLRVGYYSREIAKALNLSKMDVENIYYAGLLHDIGKIGVPDSILNKPEHLSEDEFDVIKSHTSEGATILSSISVIPNITLGARYHHEHYDGTGYPEGRKGKEIPLVARIICCADCYDAMATKRVYKEPYLTDHIIEEFTKCSGTQFDPEIANIVIKLIVEGKIRPDIQVDINGNEHKNTK
ncbi:MAG: HD-GYP domain-containing protein [Acholeplasmatales bacterium]|nr:HD-GYP domain-containing protein [Acholeplasmatales bacterium]